MFLSSRAICCLLYKSSYMSLTLHSCGNKSSPNELHDCFSYLYKWW